MEIPTLVVGNFELKSHPKGWEVWFKSPPFPVPPSPSPPPPSPYPTGITLGAAYSTYVSKNVRLHRKAPIYKFNYVERKEYKQ